MLKVGTSTSLTISGTKEDGSPADLTQASVAYSSSNPSVISVDGSGIVTALRAGSGTITVMVSLNSRVKSATVHFITTTNGLETQEIVAVADSYVDKSNPNNNYGSAVGLPVTSNGASTREAYFKFDLSQVRGKVHTAKLKIWATNSDAKGGMKENKVYQTGNDWNESTITWNNTPARGTLLGSANIDPGWKWYEIDVTSAFYGQVDQTGNFSFLVRQEEKPVMSPFSARKRQVSDRI
ncbi:DNRLRE domain-containing protein [Paenibacillus sp. RC67]|uniref:CBM96 family carbohydrate-binding protein n=1 Tax=Paenibacillus sp. RC67 TaxID=3039392 RepID=UPI0024AD18DB|nr:DNRLRE domain-containing protein [Paenibacillus sp. RC67]